jgi:hypothetical protein
VIPGQPAKPRLDRTLVLILAVAAVIHALVLVGDLGGPYGRTPINDAAYYWAWGGRVAAGELVGDAPFFSAPLYPYLLGLARALGLGLVAVLVVQLLAHLLTGALLARVGTRLFERRVGLLAAGLWLLLTGPAAAHGRVLAGTLQTLLVVVVLERALALHARPGASRAAGLGVAAGFASLAWPALLPASLALAVWAWWAGGGPRAAGALLLAAGVLVLPATLHNWLAGGELIPISAHGGLTFYHGNNSSADGVFAPHGVSNDKAEQAQDALERTRAVLGDDANWGDVSSHFFGLGLEWWRAEPTRALGLAGKKAWLFLSGRDYGDMYLPSLERRAGMWWSLWLAPLPVAWLMLPALVAAALLLRRDPRRFVPLALTLALPFAICAVFWYSPRYRLPAVPAATLLAAWALVEVWTRRGRSPWIVVAVLAAVGSGWLNRGLGVDVSDGLQTEVELRGAELLLDEQDLDGACALWRRTLRRVPDNVHARRAMASSLRTAHRRAELVEALTDWLKQDPTQTEARRALAWTLATAPEDGVRDGARALALARRLERGTQGQDPAALDVLAAALAETGETVAAAEVALRAARQYRSAGRVAEALVVEGRLALYRAGRPFRDEP